MIFGYHSYFREFFIRKVRPLPLALRVADRCAPCVARVCTRSLLTRVPGSFACVRAQGFLANIQLKRDERHSNKLLLRMLPQRIINKVRVSSASCKVALMDCVSCSAFARHACSPVRCL